MKNMTDLFIFDFISTLGSAKCSQQRNQSKIENQEDSESPWKIPQLIFWLSDLMTPFVLDSIRFVFHSFILCCRKLTSDGEIFYIILVISVSTYEEHCQWLFWSQCKHSSNFCVWSQHFPKLFYLSRVIFTSIRAHSATLCSIGKRSFRSICEYMHSVKRGVSNL